MDFCTCPYGELETEDIRVSGKALYHQTRYLLQRESHIPHDWDKTPGHESYDIEDFVAPDVDDEPGLSLGFDGNILVYWSVSLSNSLDSLAIDTSLIDPNAAKSDHVCRKGHCGLKAIETGSDDSHVLSK